MNIEALLADRGWVQRLARSLVGDAARADDLAQDGWVAALNRPPTGAVRAWWRRVLRRRAMEISREEESRRAREERVTPRRPVGPELLERLELENAIAEAVRALPETYRDAILLRYFEGMPPRAIAKRLGVPVETVRTRLKRAHGMLRERLDGVRRDWREGMALLAWPGSLLGGIVMETKKIAAGALVLAMLLLSLALVMWRGSGGQKAPDRAAELAKTVPAPDEDARPTVAPAAAAAPRKAAVLGTIAAPLPVLDGKEPVATVRILRSGREVATGRFPPGPFRIEYERDADAGWVAEVHAPATRLQTFPLPTAETDLGEIRFYQALLYGGRVLDLEGRPIPVATVQFRDVRVAGVSEPTGEDGAFRIDLDWTTHFSVNPQGNLGGVLLDVHIKEGWLGPYYASLAGFRGQCELRVDLREAEADPVLRIVAGGDPVAGARVAVHDDWRRQRPSLADPWVTGVTDSDGRVRVPWPPDIEAALVRIDRPGSTTDVYQRREEIERPVHEIDIGSAAHIAAEFVLPDGKPAEGARVWFAGEWMPDTPGKPVSAPRAAAPGYVPGSVTASLYGVVPADGVLRWSVPVERPEAAAFHPHGWFATLSGHQPLARDTYGSREMREGDPPIRIVLEEQAGETRQVNVRFRDGRGPVFPEIAGFQLLSDGRLVEAGRLEPGAIADDRVRCWLPFDLSEYEFDSVEVYVYVRGKAPATVRVAATALRAAIRDGTDLLVEMGTTATAAFHASRPTGELAKGAIITLVPESANHISAAYRLQVMTDDAGGAVTDCQADTTYAVMAFDMATGEGARIDGFRPGGLPRDIVFDTSRRTRVRIVFPDGAPAPRAKVSLETRPRYLAPVLYALTDQNGWAELPRTVPALFELHITGCDRRLMRKDAEGRPQLPMITHSTLIPMPSVNDGDTITAPMRDDVARWVAESK